MNSISENPFSAGQRLAVTILGRDHAPLQATVVDMTGPALRLQVSAALATGTPVKLEGGDALLLADVSFCDRLHDGYVAGLTARHMLTALSDLRRLGRALREEDHPSVAREAAARDAVLQR